MSKAFLKDAVGWGFIIWLVGYILGIVFFMVVPKELIGWFLMPIGAAITLWVLFKKIQSNSFQYYLWLALVWLVIAVVCDYFLLVKVFAPAGGYYKLDVYIYYILTFALPLLAGWRKSKSSLV